MKRITKKYSKAIKDSRLSLPIILGENFNNELVLGDLIKLDNVLMGGSTGSGKSTFINSTINSLCSTKSSQELKLLLIDPKKVEFHQYENSPNLLYKIIRDPASALTRLQELLDKSYKQKSSQYTVIVIDTFSDLFFSDPDKFQYLILKLTSTSEQTGIHVIMSDSRVSSELFTDSILNAFKTKIAFHTSSEKASQLLLGESGSEMLNGAGDMLVKLDDGVKHLQGVVLDHHR